mmetsp:Transcript_18088/g.39564  ORF Transcript_18088/g.39564 Transcript_18088/m.39564 type:complete len:258 (-) Transcript_18088:321-1094(-)
MEQEKAEADRLDLLLAQHIGQADSPYCDACNTFVEEFFEGWLRMLKAQNDKVEVKDGGSSAPALTYNDETEAAVQSFCKNQTNSRIAKKNLFAAHINPACERIMLGHKREIVGKFLATELAGRLLPDKKDVVCHDMANACPNSKGAVLANECQFCQATMQDMAFEMRRRQSVNQAKAERHVRDVLESLCMYTYYRHRAKGSDLQEACDDLVDEYEQGIVTEVLRGLDGTKSWRDVEHAVCVGMTDMCSDKVFRKDEL